MESYMNLVNNNKQYKNDYNTVFSCQYHVVFCTKYRRNVLEQKVSDRLKELILEKENEYKYEIIEISIMPDHVHLIIDSHPKIGIYNQVTKIKGYTSHMLRKEFSQLKSRLPTLWTRSKFISTTGDVSLDSLKKYIEEQKSK